ncbi:MAG TPA: class I SAM-dependent methyltransferase [Candidatus Paceibacterota bacterium]|nr:class I SAM-dependent methyltransferase [Candidatus Paceibacterota bacterium]
MIPLFSKKEYRYVRCGACGFVCIAPVPDPRSVYGKDYFLGAEHGYGYVDYDEDKAAMKPVFERCLAMVEEVRPIRGKLLDVGAANGYFVGVANARGWDAEGIEISSYAAEEGRRRGLAIQTGTLEDISFPDGTFDAVTMFDVLEHIPHPVSAVRAVTRMLRPGGALLINTPDTGSLVARMFGKRWHLYVPPEHLALFNAENLTKLLWSEGFEVLRVRHLGKTFTVRYIIDTLGRQVCIPVASRVLGSLGRSRLGDLRVPLNLGDNMLLVARKL